MRAYLTPLTTNGEQVSTELGARPAISNRDPSKLTVLVMTGVTAMARGTAAAIEAADDYAFPARLVGPELAAADLTIISNEIPFVAGCVVNNTRNNLILCSKPEYFASLELSGVDAVGLSGNHQNDFGYTNMLESLKFYDEMGVPVYAGGANAADALAPIYLEHNGNRLAFLGANQYGPASYTCGTGETVNAWAGADRPGSARFNLEQMSESIRSAGAQADLVLAEVQHTEFDAAGNYTVAPIAQQQTDFQALKDAGADIVTGVQAHAPQAVELRGDGIILYGLGNLYFDQTWSWRTRTGLVPRHAIYDGRLINTELLVTVIEPDMQLRWATNEERIVVLKTIFGSSRW
jgi:poly-gamma-glutamate synthesis protein (capsule biosynthesis protein)